MRALKRIVAVLACSAAMLGVAAHPVAASHVEFSPHMGGVVRCPRPWLKTGFGLLSYCHQRRTIPFLQTRTGFYSPVNDTFSPSSDWMVIAHDDVVQFDAFPGTDGVVGTFRGVYQIVGGFGRVSYGVQYAYFGLQPKGRWGNLSYETGMFHPSSGWVNADHPI